MMFILAILLAFQRADGCGGGTGGERYKRWKKMGSECWSLPTILSLARMVCSLPSYQTPELPNTPGILLHLLLPIILWERLAHSQSFPSHPTQEFLSPQEAQDVYCPAPLPGNNRQSSWILCVCFVCVCM